MLRKLLFWCFAVMFPLPLISTYNVQGTAPGPLKYYIFLGLAAYSWWLLSVLVSVRPPWLDRLVGLPAVYGLHGMLGILAIVAACIHRDLSYSPSQLAGDLGNFAFYGALSILCYSAFFMSGWLVDRSKLLQKTKRLLEIFFRRQLSVWIHRLNLVIVAMIWLHAHLLVRVNQYFAFMMLFDLYTVVTLSIYVWKKWIAPDTYLTGTVTANDARGSSTRRISMDLDRKATRLQPGDFFFLSFQGLMGVVQALAAVRGGRAGLGRVGALDLSVRRVRWSAPSSPLSARIGGELRRRRHGSCCVSSRVMMLTLRRGWRRGCRGVSLVPRSRIPRHSGRRNIVHPG
ncbi:hypothetical protein SAMN04487981_12751 [Streptomyces sp. cf386]|uniref:hypothetical protein n=1 Tax=Streptomyces sp. cf386 TaxID=1761904 RepID=UPI000890A0D7|nr:hypothetical protein [Streptomyces sp. cf386]SDP57601.1 hypothetical protein SAMN04487981_12751 [Streptomyces sp. cf386]